MTDLRPWQKAFFGKSGFELDALGQEASISLRDAHGLMVSGTGETLDAEDTPAVQHGILKQVVDRVDRGAINRSRDAIPYAGALVLTPTSTFSGVPVEGRENIYIVRAASPFQPF